MHRQSHFAFVAFLTVSTCHQQAQKERGPEAHDASKGAAKGGWRNAGAPRTAGGQRGHVAYRVLEA